VSLVLDSSTALAWIYQDENSEPADDILNAVVADTAWVPTLWWLEIANGLRTGIRRGRINIDDRDHALAELRLLNIETDQDTHRQAWDATLRLSDRLGITSYDACYLELAQRRSLPLGSLDSTLCGAARRSGVRVIGD